MARHNVLADPLSPQFLLDLAWKQRYAGDVKSAMTSLARALAMNPDQPQALSERAAMRVAAGDTAGAIDDCERVLAADAEHQAALATCAHVFAGTGRRDRAGAVLGS